MRSIYFPSWLASSFCPFAGTRLLVFILGSIEHCRGRRQAAVHPERADDGRNRSGRVQAVTTSPGSALASGARRCSRLLIGGLGLTGLGTGLGIGFGFCRGLWLGGVGIRLVGGFRRRVWLGAGVFGLGRRIRLFPSGARFLAAVLRGLLFGVGGDRGDQGGAGPGRPGINNNRLGS